LDKCASHFTISAYQGEKLKSPKLFSAGVRYATEEAYDVSLGSISQLEKEYFVLNFTRL